MCACVCVRVCVCVCVCACALGGGIFSQSERGPQNLLIRSRYYLLAELKEKKLFPDCSKMCRWWCRVLLLLVSYTTSASSSDGKISGACLHEPACYIHAPIIHFYQLCTSFPNVAEGVEHSCTWRRYMHARVRVQARALGCVH